MEGDPSSPGARSRAGSVSTIQRLRRASTSLMEAPLPVGFMSATGEAIAQARNLKDFKREVGSGTPGSPTLELARTRTFSGQEPPVEGGTGIQRVDTGAMKRLETRTLEPIPDDAGQDKEKQAMAHGEQISATTDPEKLADIGSKSLSSGVENEQLEQKATWGQAIKAGLKAFGAFVLTPSGFFICLYFALVVAFGGMLFLLLCGAAPAMTKQYGPDDNRSARKIWIEIDSQILNALFCVTGFGLIPWRFRDFYFLLRWRFAHEYKSLEKLAWIHRGWFRADDTGPKNDPPLSSYITGGNTGQVNGTSNEEAASQPSPLTVTGHLASGTKRWKMDAVVWLYVWNTFLQVVLAGLMWGFNRYNRPSWSVGLFIGLAFACAGFAGGIVWWEGRRIKKIEGPPIPPPTLSETGADGEKMKKWWQF